MQQAPRNCPACMSQHTWIGREGQTIYKTRLSACDQFKNLSIVQRANMIQSVNGCCLCLDWTGSHRRDTCKSQVRGQPYRRCSINTNNQPCGANHNALLHGSSNSYCNVVNAPPSEKEVQQDFGPKALLPMQWASTSHTKDNALVFWDCGSNISLI